MRIVRNIALCLLMLPVAACATTNPTTIITQQQFVAISPPASSYDCPKTALPDPSKLTNRDLANLITSLSKNNHICAASMASIKAYVANAKVLIAKKNAGK